MPTGAAAAATLAQMAAVAPASAAASGPAELQQPACQRARKPRRARGAAAGGGSSSVTVSRRTTEWLTYDVMQPFLAVPILEAARHLGVGLTILKRRCRQYGITRWPGRKLKSVNNIICRLSSMAAGVEDDPFSAARNEMEKLREDIICAPTTQLPTRTRRLRQAMFKDKHKLKRLAGADGD